MSFNRFDRVFNEGSMLYGEYNHNIDAKGRMNFPAKMREELGATFIVTIWSDDCLAAFTPAEWARIQQKVEELPLSSSGKLVRRIFSNAAEVEPDKQGRIMIPAKLRAAVHLDKDVTVIGAMNRAEIWDTARWEKYNDEISSMPLEDTLKELGL